MTEFTLGPPASVPPLNVSFSTFAGGSYYDKARGVALDPLGNAYIAGDTASTDFPTTAASFQNFLAGNQNAFVQKLGCLPKGTANIFVGNYNSSGECTGPGVPFACCTRAGDGTCNNGTVDVFPAQLSNCNTAPYSSIEGQVNNQCTGAGTPYACCTGAGTGACVDNTGLSYPFGIAYSPTFPSGTPSIYVVNYDSTVTVYSQAEYSTVGPNNAVPIATISGPLTELADATGIAVDPTNGNVYVANTEGGPQYYGSITVYSNAQILAGGGNIAPIASLIGQANYQCTGADEPFFCCTGVKTGTCSDKTGLNSPQGVAVDPSNGNLFVANLEGPHGTGGLGSINEYTAATIAKIITTNHHHGNLPPDALIAGLLTQLEQPSGIAIDLNRNIYVASNGGDDNGCGPDASGCVQIYKQPLKSPNGNPADVPPVATIVGAQTLLNDIEGIAVDANGLIYVANFGASGSVTVYPPLSVLMSQPGYPDVVPIADITGIGSDLYGPRGIAVDPPPVRTRRERKRH